jgi:hypothetical protein
MASAAVSPVQWAGIAFFVVLALIASTRVPEIWRGEIESLAAPTRRNRSLPAWVVAGWTMIVALPSTLYVTSRAGPVSPWVAWVLLVTLSAVAATVLVASLVWLTGRPQKFVPPRMRSDAARK